MEHAKLRLTLLAALAATLAAAPRVSLTLVPPTPATDKIQLDVRAAVWNDGRSAANFDAAVYLDRESPATELHRETVRVEANSAAGLGFRWPTRDHAGKHELLFTVHAKDRVYRTRRPLTILASPDRATGKIDGAWFSIVHWSETEGRYMNRDLERLTDTGWRAQVRGLDRLAMNVIVIEEVFRNTAYPFKHNMDRDGYPGRAFYNSKLYPGRMKIAAKDPIASILDEADRRGIHVFLGVGMYAFFDFSPGALAWHKKVATELWRLYGHHPSFYGWYVSAEICGNLLPCVRMSPAEAREAHAQVARFFRSFRAHCRTLAPDRPVMLAPNSHFMPEAETAWRELLGTLDIVCPFGFHRQPKGDLTGEEAALWLQKLCAETGAHLWLDLEVFNFEKSTGALVPRPVEGLISDLVRFRNFEKVLCFEYTGLFNAPDTPHPPGGDTTVKLWWDYQKYLDKYPLVQ
jgi:hypothetical protein